MKNNTIKLKKENLFKKQKLSKKIKLPKKNNLIKNHKQTKKNLAGTLTPNKIDTLLSLLRENYFNPSNSQLELINKYSTFDLAAIIKRLEFQNQNPEKFLTPNDYKLNKNLYDKFQKILKDKLEKTNTFLTVETSSNPPEPLSPPKLSKKPIPLKKDGTPDLRYSINKKLQKKPTKSFSSIPSYPAASSSEPYPIYEDPIISYSQHALDQMNLPERHISKRVVEEIIIKGIISQKYTLSDDKPPRRIFLEKSADPNNFIKIITSNSDTHPHVITAIRNVPIDIQFSYNALQTIEEAKLDKNYILDLIKNVKAEKFDEDRSIFILHNISVITTKDKKKILSIRITNPKK